MIKGINYWAFPAEGAFPPDGTSKPLSASAALKKTKELGFDCIEFTVDPVGAVTPETTKAEALAIKAEAEELGVGLETIAAGLAWGTAPTDPDKAVRAAAVANTKKQIELAAWLGCKSILHVPGMVSACFVPEFTPQRYDLVMERAREVINEVLPLAEKLNIKIGVENVWNRMLMSPVEMRDFVDSFDSPFVGVYFDVGNVMAFGHPEHWIEILGSRIIAVHMKDFRVNVGNLDGFVDLLAGDVPYPTVMETLRTVGYEGPCTAEYVPGILGAAEKAIAALKLIEKM